MLYRLLASDPFHPIGQAYSLGHAFRTDAGTGPYGFRRRVHAVGVQPTPEAFERMLLTETLLNKEEP